MGKIQQVDLNLGFGIKIKQIELNVCFDKRNQSGLHLPVTFYIFSKHICFLTGKIQKIYVNLSFDR